MSDNVVYSKMKMDELKNLLRERSLKVGGKKDELVARLQEDDQNPAERPVKKTATPKTPKVVKTPEETLTNALRKANLSVIDLTQILTTLYPGIVVQASDASIKPAPAPLVFTQEGLKKLKVDDLKKILTSNGQKTAGKKDELIARILNPDVNSDENHAKTEDEGVSVPMMDPVQAGNAPMLPQIPSLPGMATLPGAGMAKLPVGLPSL